MGWKKLIAYVIVIAVLLAASLAVQEFRAAREAKRRKEPQVSAGAEGGFSVGEITRVLRLRLELDAVRDLVERGRAEAMREVHERTYRRMLSALSYRESNLRLAIESVERDKEAIIREAADKFLGDEMPQALRSDAGRSRVWRAQKLLRVQGVYLGELTARADADTIYAVKTWQLRAGWPQTGEIDGKLVDAMMASYVRRRMKIKVRLFPGGARLAPAGTETRGAA